MASATGRRRGRGATIDPAGRFDTVRREAFDDGWSAADPHADPHTPAPRIVPTVVTAEQAKSIISRNQSPDVPFDRSINPYRGCEHGCIYCYARPSHGYLGLSPGLDFETRLFAKVNAAQRLREELSAPSYECGVISLGANTDPYQPCEREWKVTRQVIEVLVECSHPFSIVTKNALVERDLDLLAPHAAEGLCCVQVSLAHLDADLSRRLEPRASAPARRLETIRRLSAAGVPVGVILGPVIPFLNDHEVERVLDAARAAGATQAGYVLMRLPWEVKDLFRAWLEEHYPLKARHVMNRVQAMRDGRDNDARFGSRIRGEGELADLLAQRFARACARLGFDTGRRNRDLDLTRFRPPPRAGRPAAAPPPDAQLSLF
jgi:DNA repair photolyase